MFWNSGFDAPSTGFLVQLELEYSLITVCFWSCSSRQLFPAATGKFSCRLAWEYPTSDLEVNSPTVSSCYFHFFSFIGILRIDQIHQIVWRDFLALRVTRHQAWSRFRHRRVFVRSRLLTSIWHGALLSILIVRKKITVMATREHRETQCWTNEDDSIRLVKNFLLSKCLRVDFWCPPTFFDLDLGFQFYPVEEPIKRQHVFFLDTCLIVGLLSLIILITASLSLKRCATETRLEQNVCQWVHNPLQTDQPFAFWHFGSWLGNWVSHQFPGCHHGWTVSVVERNTSITMLQREQVVHPFAVHPKKWFQIL